MVVLTGFKHLRRVQTRTFLCLVASLTALSICLLLPLDSIHSVHAETPDTLDSDASIIYAIRVVGNRTTNQALILREIDLKPGMEATPKLLEHDRLHLLSLGIFNQVEMSLVSDRGRSVVLIRVTERFYIYPYPILVYDPADPSRRVYGMTLNHDNFRGFAEQLSVGWWDGYQRGFSILHLDPWFSLGGRYGLRTQIFINDAEIIAPDGIAYRAKTESMTARLRRRLGREEWIEAEAEWEERSSKGAFYTLSSTGRDRVMVGRLYFEKDQRDFRYYPMNGFYLAVSARLNRMVDTTHTYYREAVVAKAYRSFGRFTIAGQVKSILTQKKLPYYREVEITQYDIRSDSPVGLRGLRAATGNLELRFNIFPVHRYSIDWAPFVASYLQKMKFSIEGFCFADVGSIELLDTHRARALKAYGGGLQFQLPFIEVAHIALGWGPDNEKSKPTILLATGVTF
jgi:outer membrane protein assembly factor BamA